MTDIPRKFGFPDNIETAVHLEHWPALFSDHYELGEKVHNFVYRAKSKKDGHEVAVKFVPARAFDDFGNEVVYPFSVHLLKEIDIVNRILKNERSPFLMPCEGVVYDPDHGLGIITPWFEDGSLCDADGGGNIPLQKHEGKWDNVASIGVQTALALETLHDKDIIHRDLKPGNLFVQSEDIPDKYPRIRLGDFGLSALASYLEKSKSRYDYSDINTVGQGVTDLEDVWNERYTPVETAWGTPWFFSPEQATGQKLTVKSDLFSLGTILYEAISGERTFDAPRRQEIALSVVRDDPTHLRDIRFDSGEVDELVRGKMMDIIMSLLIKDPDRRGTLPDGRQLNTAHDVAKAIADCWKDSNNQELKETLAFQIASKY